MVFRKPNFGPPPPGYIAGLGRGASGFITRGDIGPAKIGESVPPGLGAPPGLSGAAPGQTGQVKPQAKEDFSDANYDEWNGFGGSLFAGLKEDAEDKDADLTFA